MTGSSRNQHKADWLGLRAMPFPRRCLFGALILCLAAFSLSLSVFPFTNFATFFLYRQDRWLLIIEVVLLALAGSGQRFRSEALGLSTRLVWLLIIAAMLVCYTGHYLILDGFDVSRDEQMAVFDTRIFSSGRLVQPLPRLWQDHVAALNTLYMLPISRPTAWVSAYLPMNAALRSLVGLFGDPAFTGPLMTGCGAWALWRCARLVWPDDREAAVIAVLLYLSSGQIIFAGMTAFAMPAHLALNLLWLWLFLLNRRPTDLLSLLVGFVATGLHQPLFHPLFVAPFLILEARVKNWPRLAPYVIGYGAICVFWLAWPGMMQRLVSGSHSITGADGIDYWTRLRQTLAVGSETRWLDMTDNLLRFAAWQHLLLLPLMIAGFGVVWRDRFAAALAASIVLPVLMMLLILPHQGSGFGYRYLHGASGSAILLAVCGWQRLKEREGQLRAFFLRATWASACVILPLQAWLAHGLAAGYAAANARIDHIEAHYVIIGKLDAPFADALVINAPDLSNRPIRLLAQNVDRSLLQQICGPGAVIAMPRADFYDSINAGLGTMPVANADKNITALSPRLAGAGCSLQRIGAAQ